MYTCSSQTLVHLFSSQVLLVVRHAFVLFLIFRRRQRGFCFCFCLFFYLLSLHWLIWTCSSVQSRIQLIVCPCSFISVGGCQVVTRFICHPVVLARGSWCCVTTLPNSLSLSSLYAVVATHFDLVCSSDASFFFLPYSRHNKMTLGWLPKMIINCLPIGLFVVCVLLHGKGILHLFNNVALLSSSYTVNGSER